MAIRLASSQTALALLLGCTPQCVQRWFAQGRPSAKACPKIERVLNRRVTCAQLYPALFGA